ncbi:MAG: FecR domain-containing protein [Candidatus Omnitrophota bacterium]
MKIFKTGVFVLAVFLAVFTTGAVAQEMALTVAAIEGQVLVKTGLDTEWADAKAGQALKANDSIKTLEDGKVFLEFPDKSSISLKPGTEILVETIIYEELSRKVGVKLSLGELKMIVNKADGPSEFLVKTPNAICGAHGSIVYMGFNGASTSVFSPDSILQLTNLLNNENFELGMGMPMGIGGNGFTPFGTPPDMSGFLEIPLVAEPYTPGDENAPGTVDIAPPDAINDSAASQT